MMAVIAGEALAAAMEVPRGNVQAFEPARPGEQTWLKQQQQQQQQQQFALILCLVCVLC